jgi:hypothetical protein
MANEVEVTLKLNADQAQQVIKAAEKGFNQLGDNASKGIKKADIAWGSFVGNLAAAGVSKLIGSITGAFGGLVDAGKNLETLQTRFKVLTGSAEEAQKTIDDLRKFAASTPFELPALADAEAQLISFGVATDDLVPTLGKLGDLAAGAGTSINDLALPFGRLVAQQKLTLVELDKFGDRGINVYGALAEKAGVSVASIRDSISKGQVPFKDFISVIDDFTSEGGQFFGATAQLSQTLGGVLSTLGDNFTGLQASIGGAFNPALIAGANFLIAVLQDLAKFAEENQKVLQDFAIGTVNALITGFQAVVGAIQNTVRFFSQFGVIVAQNRGTLEAIGVTLAGLATAYAISNAGLIASIVATKAATTGFALLSGALKAAGVAAKIFQAVISLNPIGLIVTGLTLAVAAFVKFNGGIDGAIGKLREFAGAALQFVLPALNAIINGVGSFVSIFDAGIAKSIRQAKKDIEVYAKELEKSGAAQNKAALDAQNSATQVEDAEARKREAVDETTKKNEEAANKNKNAAQSVFDFEASLIEQKKAIKDAETELDRERAAIKQESELEELATLIGEREALEIQAQADKLARDGQQAEAEKLIKDKLKKADEQRAFSVKKFEDKTQKEKVDGLKSTFGDISTLQSSNNKTLFRIGQAGAIANATISGLEGFSRALGSAPPPFNFILAGLVAAANAANIAKIASASPPAFQFGGLVPGQPSNADNQIISAASGEAVLNRQQQTELFNQLNSPSGAQGGSTININVESSTGDIPDESVDNIIENINRGTEFRNSQLRTV